MAENNQLATQQNAFSQALARASEAEIVETLCATVYPGAKRESALMVLAYCKAAGLDPLQKPVHIVPMSVKNSQTGNNEWRDVVMPGIGLYRIQASRTGAFLGMTEPEFGQTISGKIGGVEVQYPEWCRVTVRRQMANGQAAEFTAKEFWVENYATAGRDKPEPNAMWKRRPFGQLAKCAEAQALRKAFPEVGQQATAEEMEGKEFDITSDQPAKRVPDGVDGMTGEVLKKDEKPALPAYPDEDFKKHWPEWVALVDAGKQSWSNVQKNLASKHTLSKAQLGYFKNPETFKQEPQA